MSTPASAFSNIRVFHVSYLHKTYQRELEGRLFMGQHGNVGAEQFPKEFSPVRSLENVEKIARVYLSYDVCGTLCNTFSTFFNNPNLQLLNLQPSNISCKDPQIVTRQEILTSSNEHETLMQIDQAIIELSFRLHVKSIKKLK